MFGFLVLKDHVADGICCGYQSS